MKITLVGIYVFLAAVFFAIPNMSRRGILFAVPVPADFRDGPIGRRAIWTFRGLIIAALLAILAALLLLPEGLIGLTTAAAPFILILAAAVAFFWQHHQLEPFAVHSQPPREAAVSTAPERLPWFTWLSAGPFAILALCAVLLEFNWERIPARFPIHWGVDGLPNRWGERTIHGVYGPLFFAAVLCLWFLAAAFLSWYGARRSHLRRAVLGCLIAVQFMLASLFGVISLSPIVQIPIWVTLLGPMLFLVPIVIVMMRAAAEPGGPAEPVPEHCWKGGVIYYNPADPALVVEKRLGAGYTFNFANRLSWILLGSLLLVMLFGFLLF